MFLEAIASVANSIGGGLLDQFGNTGLKKVISGAGKEIMGMGQGILQQPTKISQHVVDRLKQFRKLFDSEEEYEAFLKKNPHLRVHGVRTGMVPIPKLSMPMLPQQPPNNRNMDPALLKRAQIYLR